MQKKSVLIVFMAITFAATGTAVGQTPEKGPNREFSVPVAEVDIQGREIPANTDAARLKYNDTTHKAKVVLGMESLEGLKRAPDLQQVSIDGRDLDATREPLDNVNGVKGKWRVTAYKLPTSTLGILTALTDKQGNVTRLLLTHEQLDALARLEK
jgi:hypothetical protein